jgi:hypothetical protein
MFCQCPSCLSRNCRRSRFRWYDWGIAMLLQQPFRCHTCFHRFYRSALSASPRAAVPVRVAELAPKKF